MRETDQHASPPLPSPAFRKRFERRLWRKTREEFTNNRSLFDGSFSENLGDTSESTDLRSKITVYFSPISCGASQP